jgi:signal transduction histidine kinase
MLTPLLRAGGIALALALVMAYLMSRWVVAPLHQMAAAAEAVAEGESKQVELSGPREVQAFGAAFNRMTEKVHTSQQSQRDFVANVSHELKTPLTSIQGFAQAILDGTVASKESLEKSARIIYNEAGRMHRLVVDLLELAKLDAGTANLAREPLNIGALLEQVGERFTPLAAQAKVNLKVEISHLPTVIGDGDRLAQVFTNLVDNAIKHTPEKGEVEMKARQVGDQIEVVVADSGPGIPPEELSRIFERFYQLDKSRRGGEGRSAGLGLAIAEEIVHAHGGRIRVSSKSGEGSLFGVMLPVVRSDDSTAAMRRVRLKE